jgi:CRISPR-associated endonuclease Csn1
LNRTTQAIQRAEKTGQRIAPPLPWPSFREDALAAFNAVFVARAERRRARGKAHEATIRQVVIRDGKPQVFERKPVAKLTVADLQRIKDPDRNQALIASLGDWLAAGKPADNLPKSPKGDPISKVRLLTKAKPGVQIDTGNPNQPASVDRGEMARVDVFQKINAKGRNEYFAVPIYPHQIASLDTPPTRAVRGNKDEHDWPDIRDGYEFLYSIYQFSMLEIITSKGEAICGYFRGLDRSTGAIKISSHHSSEDTRAGIGMRTLERLDKQIVDRLGRRYRLSREVRTWRGVACT